MSTNSQVTMRLISFDCHCHIQDLCFFFGFQFLWGKNQKSILMLKRVGRAGADCFSGGEDRAKSIKVVERLLIAHFLERLWIRVIICIYSLSCFYERILRSKHWKPGEKTRRMCDSHELCFVYVLPLFMRLFVCCVWLFFCLSVAFDRLISLFDCIDIAKKWS